MPLFLNYLGTFILVNAESVFKIKPKSQEVKRRTESDRKCMSYVAKKLNKTI